VADPMIEAKLPATLCGQNPPCCGGAHCGQRREGRLDVRALPIIYVLGPHLHPRLAHGQAEPYAGQVWMPPGSLRFTRLSHSETVGDTAWAGPRPGAPTTHPRGACLSRRARGLGPPDPRWHETCGESGQGARVGLHASRLLQCRGAYEASQHEMRPPGSTAPRKKGARRCN